MAQVIEIDLCVKHLTTKNTESVQKLKMSLLLKLVSKIQFLFAIPVALLPKLVSTTITALDFQTHSAETDNG